jgi:hypothetical protein
MGKLDVNVNVNTAQGGSVAWRLAGWTAVPAAWVQSPGTAAGFSTSIPELDEFLNGYCCQQYLPRLGAGKVDSAGKQSLTESDYPR